MINYYKYRKTAINILIILALISLVLFEQKTISYKKSPVAVKGVLDLNDWNKNEVSSIKLNGDWEFYWKQLLEPKDFTQTVKSEKLVYMKMPFEWKKETIGGEEIEPYGYATYRLIIKNVEPNIMYAVRIPSMFTAYKLWCNGVLVSQNGRVAENKNDSVPQTQPDVAAIYSRNNQISLVLQVSNYFARKSNCREVDFGLYDSILKNRNMSLMLEVFLFGATLIMGFYYMGSYLNRRKEKSNLYFSVFCFLIALRIIVTGETILYMVSPNTNWHVLEKIAYIAVYMMLPVFSMFIKEIFPEEIPKELSLLTSFICSILCIIVVLTPQIIFDATLTLYEVICMASVICVFYGIAKAWIRKREGAETILFGFTFITITVINDILFDRQYIGTKFLFPLGVFVFILCQTFILSRRFSNAFTRQEELLKTNSELLDVIKKEKEALSCEMQSRLTAEKLLNEAVQYDKLKNDFFANISHEFRTPINVILSSLQMCNIILNTPEREKIDTQKLNKYYAIMKQNSFRLMKLVNNLIDITKIDAGYFNINLCNCNIVSVVEEITMSVAEYIRDKGIELIFDTDVEEKIIACDPDKIERIILNLLSNAVKFTDPGGIILVAVSSSFDNVKISVKDTGIGIPEEQLEKIFERFTQVDKSLSRNHEGSGIGLSLVKSLVEMQGGKVKALSKLGQGSEFVIEFPAKTIVNNGGNDRMQYDETANIERISVEFSDID